VLWEAGKLGDPNLVYGFEPEAYFRTMLKHISLSEEQLKSLRILEVGYGHGRLLREIQKWSPTAYGIDLTKPPRSSQIRPGSALLGNLLSIPFMPRQFDLVVCRGVVQVTPDPRKSFACVAEQVTNGGMLYLGAVCEPGKGILLLRKVFPRSWAYPEFLRLSLASILSVARSMISVVQAREINFKTFRRFYRQYKLDIFDVISPRWGSVHQDDEVLGWFTSQRLMGKKVAHGAYVGVRADLPPAASTTKG
jgi:SAM-dependent methyltransferase